MTDLAKLQRAREAIARALDAQVTSFYDQLASVWRALDRRLPALVKAAADAGPSAIIRAQRAGRLKREIEDAMARAGYGELVDAATGAQLDDVVSAVGGLRAIIDVSPFGSAAEVRLEALKTLAGTDVLGEGEAVAHTLWKATVDGIFSARPVDAILQDLGDVLYYTAPQIRTLYDTSISIFARQAEALGVPPDAERPFVYTGPNDTKVRPFCKQQLGKVFTRAKIDELDNGQLPNVFLTCGGYSCRHAWTAVSKFSELAKLADTGERVPEFSQGIEGGGAKAS